MDLKDDINGTKAFHRVFQNNRTTDVRLFLEFTITAINGLPFTQTVVGEITTLQTTSDLYDSLPRMKLGKTLYVF